MAKKKNKKKTKKVDNVVQFEQETQPMIVSYSEEDQVKKECKSKVDEIVDMLKLDSKRIGQKAKTIKGAVSITESLFDGIDVPDLKTSESQNVLSKLAICLAGCAVGAVAYAYAKVEGL